MTALVLDSTPNQNGYFRSDLLGLPLFLIFELLSGDSEDSVVAGFPVIVFGTFAHLYKKNLCDLEISNFVKMTKCLHY